MPFGLRSPLIRRGLRALSPSRRRHGAARFSALLARGGFKQERIAEERLRVDEQKQIERVGWFS